MSDLFAAFDALAEEHDVHKLKTIGDAYVACAGAFGDGDAGGAFGDAGGPAADPAAAARRVCQMGIAMAEAVEKIASERELAVTARIGVHTGMVIGGIIGTVRSPAISQRPPFSRFSRLLTPTHAFSRLLTLTHAFSRLLTPSHAFSRLLTPSLLLSQLLRSSHPLPSPLWRCLQVRFHFDMWGNGVRGAMYLEEAGSAQRVHASNTTAALLSDADFEITRAHTFSADVSQRYGFSHSMWVAASKAPRSSTEESLDGRLTKFMSSDDWRPAAVAPAALGSKNDTPAPSAPPPSTAAAPSSSKPASLRGSAKPASLSGSAASGPSSGGLPAEVGGAVDALDSVEGDATPERSRSTPLKRTGTGGSRGNLLAGSRRESAAVDGMLLHAILAAAGESEDGLGQARMHWKIGGLRARRLSVLGLLPNDDVPSTPSAAEPMEHVAEDDGGGEEAEGEGGDEGVVVGDAAAGDLESGGRRLASHHGGSSRHGSSRRLGSVRAKGNVRANIGWIRSVRTILGRGSVKASDSVRETELLGGQRPPDGAATSGVTLDSADAAWVGGGASSEPPSRAASLAGQKAVGRQRSVTFGGGGKVRNREAKQIAKFVSSIKSRRDEMEYPVPDLSKAEEAAEALNDAETSASERPNAAMPPTAPREVTAAASDDGAVSGDASQPAQHKPLISAVSGLGELPSRPSPLLIAASSEAPPPNRRHSAIDGLIRQKRPSETLPGLMPTASSAKLPSKEAFAAERMRDTVREPKLTRARTSRLEEVSDPPKGRMSVAKVARPAGACGSSRPLQRPSERGVGGGIKRASWLGKVGRVSLVPGSPSKPPSAAQPKASSPSSPHATSNNFFVKTESVDELMSPKESRADQKEEDLRRLPEIHKHLLRRAELLLLINVLGGPYEVVTFYQAVVIGGWEHLYPLLAVRYVVLTPLLLILIAFLRSSTPTSKSDNKLAAALIIGLPAVATLCIGFLWENQAIVCPRVDLPLCAGVDDTTFPLAVRAVRNGDPYNITGVGDVAMDILQDQRKYQLLCTAAYNEGVLYCYTPPTDYLTLMAMVHTVFHYAVELGDVYRRQSLLLTTLSLTAVFLCIVLAKFYFSNLADWASAATHPFSAFGARMAFGGFWLLLAHVIGLIHYNARKANSKQHRALRLRQQRVLKNIEVETSHCEELLKNVLPPHLISSLASLVQTRVQMGRAATDSGGLGAPAPSPAPQPALIAESYTQCTFLFAKVGGLAQLINDPKAEPRRVLRLLQTMYDRFDRLADTFQVQKVRKTANEYYLVAAGLPDPRMLPMPQDRACAIAGFGFALLNVAPLITLELERMGFDLRDVKITLQVGLHSGSAIAGIIGHKTFQYDLCGDAVNTAARMCSTSEPGRVHVSDATHTLLRHRFDAEHRGEREVKGKGMMRTFFLHNAPPGAITKSDDAQALSEPGRQVSSAI